MRVIACSSAGHLKRFQAIQHYLAEIAGEAAATGAAVDAAAQASNTFGFAAAKARASQAAGTVARLAHQVHGAIGYTAEHDLHHWTKRLWAWRDECGNEAYWWQGLGAHAAQGGGAALWPAMVAASSSAVSRAASGSAVAAERESARERRDPPGGRGAGSRRSRSIGPSGATPSPAP